MNKESIAYRIIAWLRDNRPEWLAWLGLGLTVAFMVQGNLPFTEGAQLVVVLIAAIAGYHAFKPE